MIVADTSALISLSVSNALDLFLEEFEVHTTETVVEELEETAEYSDTHGEAADTVLHRIDQVTVHSIDNSKFQSSRIDPGESSCAQLTREHDTEFLITDDLRALPEHQTVTDGEVAISPIVLKALVKRDVLNQEEARNRLEQLAENRDWLGAPIYRKAQNLFE